MLDQTEETLPLSELALHSDAILDRVSASGQTIVVMREGDAVAVLVEVGQYRQVQREIALFRAILTGEQDVRMGQIVSHDDVEVRLSALLAD